MLLALKDIYGPEAVCGLHLIYIAGVKITNDVKQTVICIPVHKYVAPKANHFS
jgi:hypothetical protein